MPQYKYSMIFQYLSGSGNPGDLNLKAGWTESLYDPSASTASINQFRRLAQLRAGLLPARSYISGIRIQVVDPSGSAQTFAVNYPGRTGPDSTQADIPQAALLLRLQATGVSNVRSMRLAAIPDNNIVLGEYKPQNTFALNMNLFLLSLNGWHFRGTDLTAAPKQIASIGADGAYTLQEDLILTVGQRVKIKNIQDLDGDAARGGVFKVGTYTDSKHGILNGWNLGAVKLGTMTPFTIIYPTIRSAETSISRVVVRKVGRPSLGYRGRRSKRRV